MASLLHSNGSSSKQYCSPCNLLYEPNPDIAGQAIFISFLAHTCIFTFLALIVTPIISFYLPPVMTRPTAGSPRVVPVGLEGVAPEEIEELELQAASGFRSRGPEATAPRYVYRCYCQRVIEDTYTSQYISGLAIIVTTFLKRTEISPYHLRVIYSIVSMHSSIGLIANYHKQSFISFLFLKVRHTTLDGEDAPKWKELKFEMLDFALLLNLVLFVALSVFVPFRSAPGPDLCFNVCYKFGSIKTFAISAVGFWVLLVMAMYGNGDHSPLGWIVFTCCVGGYVGFQNWQFHSLTGTFRPTPPYPEASSEIAFSFGQILVLFMIVPLIFDFVGAFIVDIGRMRDNVVEGDPPRNTLSNFFRILLPWFINRITRDISQGINRVVGPILQRAVVPISYVATKFRGIFSFKKKFKGRRSNTSQLESGSATSRQSLTAEPRPRQAKGSDASTIELVVPRPTVDSVVLQPISMSPVTRRPTYPLPQDDDQIQPV